ncbi:YheC/YheD family protein [Aneurinibacillus sp. Ricciae_BoGa-3]|uniref:YheC/YheD family endospore coat-associated protein n=1 Tax=Aneurinibacillus sp. Ricciae_BoGa-3 TaxID=3022697 RepID=UPI0023408027|nr:YheC/YheD family protein [Aneurinibacillus sp. Ricciae_BoGa-3]WCK55497.1 YheC/YheD family protein [Aneurinibacillus sp. Ricciae_BoGa-3]
MDVVTYGWIAIHPFSREWSLHLPRTAPASLLARKQIKLKFGAWIKTLRVRRGRPDPGSIKTKIHINPKKNQVHAGPFIGILTVAGGEIFRGVRSNFKEIIEAGRSHGAFVYIIPIENIDWSTLTVTGYIYDPIRSRWLKEALPLPHVIYNRIPNREFEEQRHVKQALGRLVQIKKANLYNPHFFDKRELFSILKRKPELLPFLPETLPLNSLAILKNLMSRYSVVYLKPYNGMAGKGIYRLEEKNMQYLLQYQEKQNTVRRWFNSLKEVWIFLKKNKNDDYLAQQGIELATYNEKLFDIRLLAQKNGSGRWRITGIGIRLAGEGNITTHVPRGGSVQHPAKILPSAFPGKSEEEMLKNIRLFAINIAHALQEQWSALGEISMDIGIDKSGKIWFIESNAKPGKFDEPEIRSLSLKRTILYAQYLAGLRMPKGAKFSAD